MVRGWPVLIQDSEDGVIGCYPLAVGEGRCRAEADVRSSPGATRMYSLMMGARRSMGTSSSFTLRRRPLMIWASPEARTFFAHSHSPSIDTR